jgi:hypothetical protein
MVLASLILPLITPEQSGYQRLVGEYRGPMVFYDLTEKANKSFEIDLKITADPEATTWTIKYRFAPPRYQLEFHTGATDPTATQWIEQSLKEKFSFKLTNWRDFAEKKSDWFEIERPMISERGAHNFRRRFTVKPNGDLWSEKWIQFKGQDWEFSHRMELKKIR